MIKVALFRGLIVVSLMVVASACGDQQMSLSTTGSPAGLAGQSRVESQESAGICGEAPLPWTCTHTS